MLRIDTLNEQTLDAREMSGVMGGRRRRVVIYNTTTYTLPVLRPVVPVSPIIRVVPSPAWTVYPYPW